MRKKLRYGLIAAMILSLLVLTALAASAANFTVYPSAAAASAGTGAVGSYDSLSSAYAAVSGNGYVIKMNNDVTSDVQKYQFHSRNYTFTLDGGGHCYRYTGEVDGYLLSITTGNVTVKNISFIRGTTDGVTERPMSVGGRSRGKR